MTSKVTITVDDGLAVVRIDNPPVNALSHEVREGLLAAARQTEQDAQVRAVVLACSGRTFVAGADIKEFGAPPKPPITPDVMNAIEQTSKPWIAALHGNALGGGLELALACDFRIADPATKMGFPEVNIGLVPGAGGTVRLPRVIAMAEAITMVSTGRPKGADRALSLGLIDAIADTDLLAEAAELARTKMDDPRPPAVSARPILQPLEEDQAADSLRAVQKKAKGQQAPVAAAKLVIAAASQPPDAAMAEAQQIFQKLRASDESAALRYIFFAEKSVPKFAAIDGVRPRAHQHIGVVGGGTMGAAICAGLLLARCQVVMIEQKDAALDKGMKATRAILQDSHRRGLLSDGDHQAVLDLFVGTTDYGALADADLVIEAVFEDMQVKMAVFQQLDAATRPDAVLVTNTSYLDINELATRTNDPSRVFGLHFFSPAHIMKLVEVVHTARGAPDALATVFALARKLGKIAVPAGVCDGFIANRIMAAYRLAGECLLEDGALPHQVDAAMREYGFPMGIFEMQDLAGLDIGYAMRQRRAATRKPDERYVDIPDKLVEAGRLGRKSGQGYYDYPDGKAAQQSGEVNELIAQESERKGITRREMSADEIIQVLLKTMRAEAHAVVAEGIADSEQAVDVAMVNGFGFPRWRGGPMFSQRLAESENEGRKHD